MNDDTEKKGFQSEALNKILNIRNTILMKTKVVPPRDEGDDEEERRGEERRRADVRIGEERQRADVGIECDEKSDKDAHWKNVLIIESKWKTVTRVKERDPLPISVKYHRLGYLFLDKYILHPIDWTICGELKGGVIKVLTSTSELRPYRLLYRYNPQPNTYWKNLPAIKRASRDVFNNISIKQLVELVKRRNPLVIKNYIKTQCMQKLRNNGRIKFTREDYINILTTSNECGAFYPVINQIRSTADNYTDWIFYEPYQCWIDKSAERCSCFICYPIRDVNEYSYLNLKNNHDTYCNCNECMCFNTRKLNECDDNMMII